MMDNSVSCPNLIIHIFSYMIAHANSYKHAFVTTHAFEECSSGIPVCHQGHGKRKLTQHELLVHTIHPIIMDHKGFNQITPLLWTALDLLSVL